MMSADGPRKTSVNNKERLVRSESIMRRQRTGNITPEEASREMDEIFMVDGELVYHSDSTGMTAAWDSNVMAFPSVDATPDKRVPSNTGIYARGPQRGYLVTHPAGSAPNCAPSALEHFLPMSKGWIGERPN